MIQNTSNSVNYFRGDYSFLSNFFMTPVDYKGRTWKSAEHAYQASKCKLYSDIEKIHSCLTAKETKALGKVIIRRDDWTEELSLKIMKDIVKAKFQNDEMKKLLLETGDMELIEGNYWKDTFWGVDEKLGGKNHLGRILMEVREELKHGFMF